MNLWKHGKWYSETCQAMQNTDCEPEFIDMEVVSASPLSVQNEVIESKSRSRPSIAGQMTQCEPDKFNHEPVDLDRDPNDLPDPKDDRC